MKELKLGMNLSFFISLSVFALGLVALDALLISDSIYMFSFAQMALSAAIIFYIIVGVWAIFSGQSRVIVCNQGVAYQTLFGQKYYIPAEEVEKISVERILWFSYTKLHMANRTLRLWSFKPSQAQQRSLKVLGYF
ncbi:hypothetical protein HUZ36_04355 [Pseudoalteromonas sp. McH1-7]|uniref:Uncharacterized protein n=1 Tax=Pseudoalteromonas peptidolytica F12-50-A1 TaxID=1315280 RepID=A0A8I0N024_9GAMM|nr:MULTISPECIES: hypothetical protein [Pseudoalteromonas]NUZ10004.1 hypothetical protein [Pseudoalteromonas sp. McH1-7]MBE0348462.1 hypothetical protein [Pseudoalteromonas peptidolytica F12-50-A1]MDW7549204.1 hypothetical protein [Pseudoalteromonas peptidolytica]NLR15050.1 hypothetical protein [Pseudoalteromonas peptidolytica]USD30928.1 hypothetical protein J8Z24_18380 [Pseudoalteromonas sp. SCSIO 43201]